MGWRTSLIVDTRGLASLIGSVVDADDTGRSVVCFFFNDTATTEIYTLSLHDALPICDPARTCAASPLFPSRCPALPGPRADRKSTRLNSSHSQISYAVFCLKKKKNTGRPLSRMSHNHRWRAARTEPEEPSSVRRHHTA